METLSDGFGVDEKGIISSSSTNPDRTDALKEAKKRAEYKLELLKKRHEDELTLLNETRVDNILKNSGAREYIERLNERSKAQDVWIKNLREKLHDTDEELNNLKEKYRDAEKRLSLYMNYWKEAQMAKETLEKEKNNQQSRETKLDDNSMDQSYVNHSSASSFIENAVPPPPDAEPPSLNEIMQSQSSSRGNASYRSINVDIPPPPPVDVPLDEILDRQPRKAFEQEQGQFIFRAYVEVDLESTGEAIREIVDLIQDRQTDIVPNEEGLKLWKPCPGLSGSDTGTKPHVTLIRGHRAVYYHQIKPLVESIQKECATVQPFSFYLDRLEIFHNHEKTKQFLCIAVRPNQLSSQLVGLKELKQKLKKVIDMFATKLTEEDETEDTVAHCSIMSRDINLFQCGDEVESELEAIDAMWSEYLEEFPTCLVRVERIYISIGKHTYKCNLST